MLCNQPTVEWQPEAQTKPEKRRILIVDDEVEQTEVLKYRFARQGYEAISVNTGSEALTLARQGNWDAILLDIEMPDINGLDVCQSLSDATETCDIPIILLSGSHRTEVIRHSRAAGSQFFMSKPYDPNALLVVTQAAIDSTNHW